MSWYEGWAGGLMAGSALGLLVELGVRWVIARRQRNAPPPARCAVCDGFLGENGAAEFPVPCLMFCDVCGDTWPDVIVERTEQAVQNGHPPHKLRDYLEQ
jgi:hypothetical protein